MPRRSRRRPDPHDPDEPIRLRGSAHVEQRRGRAWNVQPVAGSAEKTYTCPGCGLEIGLRVEHVVVWRADGVLGDAADLEARRHWHTHCWRVAS